MKKTLLSLTLSLIFSIGISSQSNIEINQNTSFEFSPSACDNGAVCDCEDAQIFCGSEFDGYCSVMSSDACGSGGTISGCGGTFHNPTWVGFVSGQADVSFIVHSFDCQGTGPVGLQYGVYDDCDMENPIFLECDCQPSGDYQIDLIGLTIGKIYYLFVDGCGGSICTISIEVLQIGDDIGEVAGPDDLLCNSDFPDCEDICVEDEVTFTMENIENAVEYIWTMNDDEIIETETPELTYQFMEAGSYHLCGYGQNGCDTGDEICIDFEVNCDCQVLNIITEIQNVDCNGSCNGSIEITDVENGNEPFTYSWSTGESTATISDLCPGEYTVSITTVNLCSVSETFTITEPLELVCNASATDETANDNNDGTATANPTGGTGSYSYSWSNGKTTQSIEDLSPGDYTVTVTDENECTCEQTVTVNEFICPDLSLEFNQTDVNCYGECTGKIEITDLINGVEAFYFEWSTGDDENTISNLCAGEYSVTVTDYYYCTLEQSFTITEPDSLAANINSTDVTQVGATDGTAIANPTGGNEPYSYIWSTGETSQSIQNLAIGTYIVTVTDNNDCEIIDSAIINEFTCPDFLVYSSQQNVKCYNECTGSIEIDSVTNSIAPLSYIWNNGNTTALNENLCSGMYFVTITDDKNCEVIDSFTISQSSQLFANASATDETVKDANDGTATANPSGGVSPYNYSWSNGENTQSISGLTPGNYTVTVTDAYECTSVETVNVAEFGCQGLSIENNKTNVSCNGNCNGSIEITGITNGTPPFTYNWNTGESTAKIESLCKGTYTVDITDGNNCTIYGSFYISEPQELLVNITTTNETANNANNGIATAKPTGGSLPYQYNWSNGNTTKTITNLSPGEYLLTVTDANGCDALDTFNIAGFICPSMTITIDSARDVRLTPLGYISISTSNAGGYAFSWAGPNNFTSNTEDLFDLTDPGCYTLTVSDTTTNCNKDTTICLADLTATYDLKNLSSIYLLK